MEERLRRSLGLAGLIEAAFEPLAVPIVIVDDATRPGTATYRNRGFQARHLITLTGGGVITSFAFQALAPMIIDSLWLNPRDTGSAFPAADFNAFTADLFLAAPGTVPTYAVATLSGIFTEVNVANLERPGLFFGTGPTWAATTALGAYGCRVAEQLRIEGRFYLPTGAFLAVNVSTNSVAAVNGNLAITLMGRIF